MITLLLLGAFGHTSDKNLAAARYRFNELAQASGADGIYAMMMGLWAEVYYPAGMSDRRFTVRFGTDEPGKPVQLQYQVLSRGKAKVKMSVPITTGNSTPLKGPIIRWLRSRNVVVKVPERLSTYQKRMLAAPTPLAGYMELDPVSNQLLAGFILPDGTVSSGIRIPDWREGSKPSKLPMTNAEAIFLKLGVEFRTKSEIPHRFEYESHN